MKPETTDRIKKGCLQAVFIFIILFILFGVAMGPVGTSIRGPHQSLEVQNARALALALFQYANDRDNRYPDGASSTEVFQKLMDAGYLPDTTLLYLPFAGKIKPIPDQKKIRPENVCWDITGGGLDASSSDSLPVVFVTGFKVSYIPGGKAVRVPEPATPTPPQPHSWWQSKPEPLDPIGQYGIAAAYKSNTARFIRLDPDGTIHDFVPPEFKPDGKTYRQLTPDGILP